MATTITDWAKVAQTNRLAPVTNFPGIRDTIKGYGVTGRSLRDDGHILSFHWHGNYFYVVDQERRITGSIQADSIESLESEVIRIGERILSSDKISEQVKEEFVRQYDFRQFVFEGRPSEVIHDAFELASMPITRVMDLYREGRKTTGHFGSISYVPGTITRAVSDAFYRK